MKRLVLIACCLSWTTLADAFDHGIWDGLLQRHVQPIRGRVATQVD